MPDRDRRALALDDLEEGRRSLEILGLVRREVVERDGERNEREGDELLRIDRRVLLDLEGEVLLRIERLGRDDRTDEDGRLPIDDRMCEDREGARRAERRER
jgi:hypothetical protein